MTKQNPPIKGHTLIAEGLTFPIWEGWEVVGHSGGCQCGAKPPEFPNVSTAKMKKWHREHKEELRATMTDEKLTPERAVRLLRAKGAELEQQVLYGDVRGKDDLHSLVADVALIAQLLADHIENSLPHAEVQQALATQQRLYPPPSWPEENQP